MKTLEESLRLVRTGTLPDSGFSYLDTGEICDTPIILNQEAILKGINIAKPTLDDGQMSIFAHHQDMTIQQMLDASGAISGQIGTYRVLNLPPLLLPEQVKNKQIIVPTTKLTNGSEDDYYNALFLTVMPESCMDQTIHKGILNGDRFQYSYKGLDSIKPFNLYLLQNLLEGKQLGDYTLKSYDIEGALNYYDKFNRSNGNWYTYKTNYLTKTKDYSMQARLVWDNASPEMLKELHMRYQVYGDSYRESDSNKESRIGDRPSDVLATFSLGTSYSGVIPASKRNSGWDSRKDNTYYQGAALEKRIPGMEDYPNAMLRFDHLGKIDEYFIKIDVDGNASVREELTRHKSTIQDCGYDSLQFRLSHAPQIMKGFPAGNPTLDYMQTIENLSNLSSYSKQELIDFAPLAFDTAPPEKN